MRALAQHRHLVSPLIGQAHVVGRHDQRGASLVKARHEAHQVPGAAGVEAGQRFVKDQRLRAHGYRAGDGGALLLPVAEHMRGAVPEVGDLERLERVFDATACLYLGDAEIQRPERHVLVHAAGEELVVGILEDEADGRAQRREPLAVVGDRLATQQHRPGPRPQGAVEMQEKGGLAGAVRADDRQAATGAHLEREPRETGHVAVAERDLSGAEDRPGGRREGLVGSTAPGSSAGPLTPAPRGR